MSANTRNRRQLIQEIAATYRGKPGEYVKHFLQRVPTDKQLEILRLLQLPPYRVLVRSATNVGKTFAAACQASYTFDCFVPSIVQATAPTKDSVRDLLFKELRRIRPVSDGFYPKDTRLEFAPDHYVHGFTAKNPDSFQGRHEKYQGFLFEEATGVDAVFWKRVETMFKNREGHWWLALYNPNEIASYAFSVENNLKRAPWHIVVLSALEHLNIAAYLAGLPPVIENAVEGEEIVRRIQAECRSVTESEFDEAIDFEFAGKLYRPETPEFEAQILGRWPIAGNDAIWSPIVFDKCRNNVLTLQPDWPFAAGVDVARFGDDKTTIAIRKGPCLIYLEAVSNYTTTQIAERVKVLLYHVAGSSDAARQIPVYVDETGGYGIGVLDQSDGYNFVGVNSSEQSPDPRFPNTRSWLWWNCRYIADSNICDFSRIADFEALELKRELCSPRYHLDKKCRRVVEVKSQIRSRLGRSPDRADAVNLCYYLGV